MNKIFIIGNLTRDPELRSTASGVPYCTFSVAVSRRFPGSNGERITDFFNVTTWRALAENCSKYLAKGRKVSIVGELQIRNYEDKQGVKRTAVDVAADEVEFLTPKSEGANAGFSSSGYSPTPPPSSNVYEDVSGFTEMEDSTLPF